jgi:hypothetical protein
VEVEPLAQPPSPVILGVAAWVTYGDAGITLGVGHPLGFLPPGEIDQLADAFLVAFREILALAPTESGP